MRSPRLSSSRRRARPSAMRVRAPPVVRTSSPPRATRTTSSLVSGSAPRTITYSLYREGELRFVGLAAHCVLHLHANGVLARADGLLEVDPHGSRHVPLRVEGAGLLDRGLGLGPHDLAAGRDDRGHVLHVDLILL